MEQKFNARIYSQGAIMSISEIDSRERDYFDSKKEAVDAIERVCRENINAVGGEVLKLSNGHYRTVYSTLSNEITC